MPSRAASRRRKVARAAGSGAPSAPVSGDRSYARNMASPQGSLAPGSDISHLLHERIKGIAQPIPERIERQQGQPDGENGRDDYVGIRLDRSYAFRHHDPQLGIGRSTPP